MPGHNIADFVAESAGLSTTFTSHCVYGCTVQVVDGLEQPHVCVGEQVIAALAPEAPIEAVQRIATGLQPLLRELLGGAWEDGVRSGRAGLCYGVDDDVPDGTPIEQLAAMSRNPGFPTIGYGGGDAR